MSDFPKLSESTKELITLGVWGMYELEDGSYLIHTGSYCSCCNPKPMKVFLVDKTGEVTETKDEAFYRQSKAIKVVRFKLPESMTDRYLKIKI